jgi:hypothetical protein
MRAERACLGAALLENALLRGPLASLAVDDFYLSAHREIFGLMLQADADGLPFDILTLTESLRQRGALEAVGDVAYLADLTDGVVIHAGLIQRHAETVVRFSQLRRLEKLADEFRRRAREPGAEPARMLAHFQAQIGDLQNRHDPDGKLLLTAFGLRARRAELLTLAAVDAKPIDWLWKPYLPTGMLALLSGDPGAGKTFCALAIAAAITTGHVPYTGEPCEPRDVLSLSIENSPEHVLRPRFDALGGDPNRFHILRGAITGEGDHALRERARLSDVQLLGDAMERTKAGLVMVDPIQSYLGAEVDAHRFNETRPVMDGLSRLAEEFHCNALLLRHLGKARAARAIHQGLGSIDLTGAARSELMAGCVPDDPAQRAIVHVKSNLGQLGPSIGYAIDDDGAFRWTGESELTASALLSPEGEPEEAGALEQAEEFLQGALAQGARSEKEIAAEARQDGISNKTLKRAKKKLGVRSRKDGMRGAWEWSLPEDGQQ